MPYRIFRKDQAAVIDQISDHLKKVDEKFLGKTRSHNYYRVEADYLSRLAGLDRSLRLRVPLIVLDFETTGLHPERNKPVSLGVIVLDKDLNIIENQKWDIDSVTVFDLLSPEFWAAQKIHKIPVRKMLFGGTSLGEVTDDLDMLQFKYPTALVAGHNVGFDYRFLVRLYELAGKPCPFEYHTVDLSTLATVFLGVKSLNEIAKKLGIDAASYKKHDALDDAFLTATCLSELIRRL